MKPSQACVRSFGSSRRQVGTWTGMVLLVPLMVTYPSPSGTIFWNILKQQAIPSCLERMALCPDP